MTSDPKFIELFFRMKKQFAVYLSTFTSCGHTSAYESDPIETTDIQAVEPSETV